MSKSIHVAVGVIARNNQYLVARRAKHKHQGGCWEFPGGKVEASEAVTQALTRELKEELAINVVANDCTKLCDVKHQYDDLHVWLDVWLVPLANDETPHGAEGQEVQWVDLPTLLALEFPAANAEILAHLQQAMQH
ncbi:(deoxy)nucleoside triphosphate pyrophosphohydrolase [Salinibius halmophilus]|uniref:(deoxy)nucleoside triphosphate pyrophosphohydrolase n=1 Tax=Salinibius halmophilus TaxID=1853216 RepID=UPI000E665A62|nr:(deoxy)nucleoside triphosphate pyrophosphohydrolase [Salinibius halmophilus]